ncbi:MULTISPECIES: NAD-dependent succinate-semialdehyde dehydrogenase [unclassified Cryobacterium]|uniref:NAD-dependent succinate-semialdehyde dehydrogenase n=1 Tax=unclassified Cryobacterium TaxID=2649013 RepID=UPI002AB53D1D|nr:MULTISPECIES: NAD-dependent succinate-semialdehyde dehydrogenase [unclassified Cryobacterium]MDY7526593.1 NAD-dependent succinate-semialdehyde dehydrogenase [Cryobacterium sp. 10C2]MDY7557597.1 NAD-dependent succinate-semialdehyde dehydrogenase [Cryobacterium sp. 10C3]MEB0291302.1 NAD-dependent succinate-semialdehyde dehydrogenase [Cryobacterium sp. 10C2]
MAKYATINPATGERVAEFDVISDAEARQITDRASAAYPLWKKTELATRTAVLRRMAELHRERAEELAAILTLEMGKTRSQALGEVALVANIYEYYADRAAEFMADERLAIVGKGSAYVRTEPIGALVGIMPWNYPYYQVARFVAPNIALGNTIILKHARNCPQSALAIEGLFQDAGLPADVYINAFASAAQISDMIADPRVQGVSLTGSERAGSAVGEVAGRHMKKYVLELGGSDPFIVLDDADIAAAATAAATGRLGNCGQACTASKRFIVLDAVYTDFVEKFVAAVESFEIGDPTQKETRLGPMASAEALQDLDELVQDAIAKGATVLTGGGRVEAAGAFYTATLLADVSEDMRVFREELFGPAGVVYRVKDEVEAIALANNSPFGLSSSIFTADVARAENIASQLEAGMVWINSTSSSAPDLPFGGVKGSGVGRELAKFGFNEFANKKLVRVP